MAILKAPPRPPKNETVQIRVEEEIRGKLHKYAEFIDSSESYVVSEALKLLFRKDDDFKIWLEEQSPNGIQSQTTAGSPTETIKGHLTPATDTPTMPQQSRPQASDARKNTA